MPTVLRSRGFEVRIYHAPREHGPPHVHVFKGGKEVIVAIGDIKRGPKVRRVRRMPARQVASALNLVAANRISLLDAWRRLHAKVMD